MKLFIQSVKTQYGKRFASNLNVGFLLASNFMELITSVRLNYAPRAAKPMNTGV
jgi:hypothetical protein